MPSTILYMQCRGCGPCRLKALTNNPAVADDWIGLDKTTLVQSPTLYNYNKPPSYNNARFTAFRFSSSLSSFSLRGTGTLWTSHSTLSASEPWTTLSRFVLCSFHVQCRLPWLSSPDPIFCLYVLCLHGCRTPRPCPGTLLRDP